MILECLTWVLYIWDKMVLECLTWIPHICSQLVGSFIIFSKKKSPVRPLPDDVTIEILSRLPADCVIKCQQVCRKWRALTSSPSFAELHLKRATTTTPLLFLHWMDSLESMRLEELNFFIYDKAGIKPNNGRRRIITKVRPKYGKGMFRHGPRVLGSCDGLILFLALDGPYRAFVFNPITQEQISIEAPFRITAPCGIYRHPSTREYKLLLSVHNESPAQYYTGSLKSMVFEKLEYSSTCRTRGILPAILLNGSLHWMVKRNINNNNDCTDAIMVFSTETEDFRVLPHPGHNSSCYNRQEEHFNMYLLGTREHLCLCHVLGSEINVWVLQDYADWGWNRRYKVNLKKWNQWRYPFQLDPEYNPIHIRILGIHNGVELLISWYFRGMFLYNLEHKTVTKVAFKVDGTFYCPQIRASAYTKSLVRIYPLLVSKQKKKPCPL